MLWNGPLTRDDLDEIGSSSFDADDPLAVAAELVAAVDQGMLVDEADTGYALILAADITERENDLEAALALAERGVVAYRKYDDGNSGYSRAFRAELLLRSGRDEAAAMAEFAALRPLLTRDPDAVDYVSEALESAGRAEIAEQWLSAALKVVGDRLVERRRQESEQELSGVAAMVYALTRQRHRLRRDLDLPHDRYDEMADELRETMYGAENDDDGDRQGTVLLFWPRAEFEQLASRWPEMAEEYAPSWEEHRTRVERNLRSLADEGASQLALLAGSADGLAVYATNAGGDPTDSDVQQEYAESLQDMIEWPPGRNAACWCGSGAKYKKCCLPRVR